MNITFTRQIKNIIQDLILKESRIFFNLLILNVLNNMKDIIYLIKNTNKYNNNSYCK